jgi:hypothetical protein
MLRVLFVVRNSDIVDFVNITPELAVLHSMEAWYLMTYSFLSLVPRPGTARVYLCLQEADHGDQVGMGTKSNPILVSLQ